jgi:hypothetical protein
MVRDGLRRKRRELVVHVALDVVRFDPVERPLAEVGHEVAPQVATVVLNCRPLAPLYGGQVLHVAPTRLGQVLSLRPTDRYRPFLHAEPQFRLRLRAG